MLYLGMNKRNNQNQIGNKEDSQDFVKVNVNQKRRCKMVKVKEVKKTEVVKVKQVKKTSLTVEQIKKTNPVELDSDYNYLELTLKSNKGLMKFLKEKNYPTSNNSKKTRLVYLHNNNMLLNKTLRELNLSFRPNKKSYNLIIKLGYKIQDKEVKKNGRIINGKLIKA